MGWRVLPLRVKGFMTDFVGCLDQIVLTISTLESRSGRLPSGRIIANLKLAATPFLRIRRELRTVSQLSIAVATGLQRLVQWLRWNALCRASWSLWATIRIPGLFPAR